MISYGYGRKFCAIAPHGQWVNVQFHNGASLDDPATRLQGAGKSMRHAKLSSAADMDGALAALIEQAAAAAK